MLDAPIIDDKFLDQQTVDGDIEPWEIRIKRKNIISTKISYNPLDAVGWHGSLMPVKINVKNFEAFDEPSLSFAAFRTYHQRANVLLCAHFVRGLLKRSVP